MADQPASGDHSTRTVIILVVALLAAVIFVVMRPKPAPSTGKTPFEIGRRIYLTVCVNCHHPDPAKEYSKVGNLGPPIAGSPFELIKMRVLSTSYPKGYKPKRNTQLMTIFKMKDEELRALHTFVNHPDSGKPDDEEDEKGK